MFYCPQCDNEAEGYLSVWKPGISAKITVRQAVVNALPGAKLPVKECEKHAKGNR